MSFGRAASASARPNGMDPCPCGSGASFDGCCAPMLRGESSPTPEQLMRSRYTAFVVGDTAHPARSWHPRTRPEEIAIDPDVRWTGLQIIDAPPADGDTGVVEFRAEWIQDGDRGALHERSRFVRLRGRWVYVDGDVR
ncbi:YchJ family metal-binding protein [Microbacterium sp. NPDC064584]|uniref:YchJ family protein n=1 Tax=Microbacterium sp. NPDC064584 TaxID=3155817 RepID=UPI00343137DA